MAKIFTLLGFLFLANQYFAEQTLNTDTTLVEILFAPSPDGENLYTLTCITNSTDLFGTINIYSAKGTLLLQLKDIEIPHAPGYHGIDVSTFPKGEITVEIFVDDMAYRKTFRL
jgi:hypothetical protein